MAFPATLALVFLVIFRPFEIWQSLNVVRPLDVLTVVSALGITLDFALQKQRHLYTPQLPFLGAVIVIVFVTSMRFGGQLALDKVKSVVILAVFMLSVVYGVRTLTRLRSLLALLAGLALFVSIVAVDQGLTPPQCIVPPTAEEALFLGIGTPDGRLCEYAVDCRQGGDEYLDVDYLCERTGMLNTVSTGRRVRWRGELNDPNELAVFLGAALPLTIALALWKKRLFTTVLAAVAVALALVAVVMTQSRGGQLVVGAVFAIYFVSRFGTKGLLAAALLAAPVILLGGRSGADADESAYGRTELLYNGMSLLAQHPILGIGMAQFPEYAGGYTAHNAYLLAATELGLPGFFCWTGLLWASAKVPVTLLRAPPEGIDPAIRTLALALLASFAGMAVGIFFLSFTFKSLLFVWLGIPGALYGVVKTAHPEFDVRMKGKDLAGIFAFDMVILSAIYIYTRVKI